MKNPFARRISKPGSIILEGVIGAVNGRFVTVIMANVRNGKGPFKLDMQFAEWLPEPQVGQLMCFRADVQNFREESREH